MEKHYSKAMITYQYESKYDFNPRGFYDCLVDYLVIENNPFRVP